MKTTIDSEAPLLGQWTDYQSNEIKIMVKRIVKEPAVRREEILNAAEKLFERDGYTKTSVESIIKEVGVAKGTIYYYFKSKQDILNALVDNIANDIESHFKAIIDDEKFTAMQKLELMIRGPKKKAKVKPVIMEIIHKPENREIQEQLNIRTVEQIATLMAQVFEQGYKEGSFKRPITLETVQLILAGSQFVLDSGLFDWSAKKRTALLESSQTTLELLLGAKPGSLGFIVEK